MKIGFQTSKDLKQHSVYIFWLLSMPKAKLLTPKTLFSPRRERMSISVLFGTSPSNFYLHYSPLTNLCSCSSLFQIISPVHSPTVRNFVFVFIIPRALLLFPLYLYSSNPFFCVGLGSVFNLLTFCTALWEEAQNLERRKGYVADISWLVFAHTSKCYYSFA